MTLTRHRASLAGLCLSVLVGLAACSDDVDDDSSVDAGTDVTADVGPDTSADLDTGPDADTHIDPDAGAGSDADAGPDADASPDSDAGPDTDPDADPGEGLRLRGQLVPTGGLSLSSGFTLSGHLTPGVPEQQSSSANFRLKLTPASTGTGN